MHRILVALRTNDMAKRRRVKKIHSYSDYYMPTLVLLLVVAVPIVVNVFVEAKAEKEVHTVERFSNAQDVVSLPVPSRNVPRGTPLSSVSIQYIEWPKSKEHDNYVTDHLVLEDTVTSVSLPAFSPIPQAALVEKGADGNALVEQIPQGMRAITVTVNEETAIEGWAQSGSYVDVIALTTSKNAEGMEARVIAENVKILSAGRSIQPKSAGEGVAPKAPPTVTLLCDQDDALKIKMATTVGAITFSLRGNLDQKPTKSVSLSQNRLFGESRLMKSSERYIGEAKGPNGDTYLLRQEDGKWVKKVGIQPTFSIVEDEP